MNQFVQRVANYVANEIVIKGLANSKTFQKFAVRTNQQYEEVAKKGTENIAKTLEEMAQEQAGKAAASASASSASTHLQPPKPPLRGIPGFFVAFFKELKKDV
eukprot:CAMPEP_0117081728 /NCGR_PEP_ID=MMETSP0472-20121206/57578_1 /TAXON_ID=693140 ORGANISM="Tiarina fusus, Strain LIS" /NCGR_SAMPLE_ID=MMETSP0472 /ASSEMBLY_ACC=CAM_ASM_000603 /LENGTH=102 /DNA_ID=CAMNT_0004809727 /DNA_START=257 /DNA_END=561 /DNA_ORIENTATION=+